MAFWTTPCSSHRKSAIGAFRNSCSSSAFVSRSRRSTSAFSVTLSPISTSFLSAPSPISWRVRATSYSAPPFLRWEVWKERFLHSPDSRGSSISRKLSPVKSGMMSGAVIRYICSSA
ncbi:MAG: hypothetical protein BWY99_02891 [Synergistetes bacterium ADurb.BinA166]|nr:MAG: hypothetical protein BWY99_02891 [Synergistetes bacterium ADurb.BinA166]